ncbi:MAG: type II secretion system protein [Phycisphaerales bacterium]|nr:MAG: type II secretion system protein [Phycisphaerales bacterium]
MNKRRALTLIETVLALAMVAGMGVAVLSAIGAAARTDAGARERRLAQTLVEDMIAEISAVPVARQTISGSDAILGIPITGTGESTSAPAVMEPAAIDPAVQSLITGSSIPSEGRLRFASVRDYADWVENPPRHRNGEPMEGFPAAWRRAVSVQGIHPLNLSPTGSSNPRAYFVRVEVTSHGRLLASREIIRTDAWDQITSREEDR